MYYFDTENILKVWDSTVVSVWSVYQNIYLNSTRNSISIHMQFAVEYVNQISIQV